MGEWKREVFRERVIENVNREGGRANDKFIYLLFIDQLQEATTSRYSICIYFYTMVYHAETGGFTCKLHIIGRGFLNYKFVFVLLFYNDILLVYVITSHYMTLIPSLTLTPD